MATISNDFHFGKSRPDVDFESESDSWSEQVKLDGEVLRPRRISLDSDGNVATVDSEHTQTKNIKKEKTSSEETSRFVRTMAPHDAATANSQGKKTSA